MQPDPTRLPQAIPATWHQAVNTQPQWVQQMLKHIDFDPDTDINDGLQDADYLLVISDGSENYGKMTYSWLISTPEGIPGWLKVMALLLADRAHYGQKPLGCYLQLRFSLLYR